jgi:hypothetical protein
MLKGVREEHIGIGTTVVDEEDDQKGRLTLKGQLTTSLAESQ